MKKLLFLVILSMMCAVQASAEKISEQQAYDIAQRFFQKAAPRTVSSLTDSPTLRPACASTSYYAFSRGNNGGYVIVAADSESFSSPIIAYADSGTLDAEHMPDAMRWWLNEYDRALAHLQSTGGSTQNTAATSDYADIAPLLTSKWGQDAPYNEKCPTVNGKQAPTGCVATALSQIIYYNKYPSTAYNYAAMTDTYSASSTTEAKDAVAQLMYDVGLACHMNYGESISGAVNIDGARAMADKFHYEKDALLLSRDFYTNKEWTDMLYNSLAAGKPVFYAGLNAGAGHAFVCDGYQDGYFHFNWGWEGVSDGYFLLDALNPKDQGTGGSSSGYNLQQEAIFNLQPAESGADYATLMYCYTDFDVSNKEHTATSTATFTGSFLNYSLVEKDITLGLKVVDANENVLWLDGGSFTDKLNTYEGPSKFEMPMSQFPTADGQYTVYPAYRDNATGKWQEMRVNKTLKKTQLIAYVSQGKIKFANTSADNTPQLEFSAWACTPSPLATGKSFLVTVDITNNGTDYADDVRFVMNSYPSNETATVSSPVALNLASGETTSVVFEGTAPSVVGIYKCFVYDTQDRQLNSVPPYIQVEEAPVETELALSLSEVIIENQENVSVDNPQIAIKVTCESGTYNGQIKMTVTQGTKTICYKAKNISFTSSGLTKTIEYSGTAFSGLQKGQTYDVSFAYYLDGAWLSLGEAHSFTTEAEGLSLSLASLSVENENSVLISNIGITAQIVCNSGTYIDGSIACRILNETGDETIASQEKSLSISKGETQTIDFSGAFEGVEEGKTYQAAIFYELDGEWISLGNGKTFTTATPEGIESIQTARNATLYSLSGIRLLDFANGLPDLSSLTPGIYILRSGDTVRRVLIRR